MENIINLLIQHKYLILFPLAIVEGPILAVIAGFLCASGFLNPLYVFPIIVLGDIIGDSICYMMGRFGTPKLVRKIGRLFGLHAEKIERVKIFFYSNPIRTISLSKIILGVGVAGIFMTGKAKAPYDKFIKICLVTSMIQYVAYIGIGLIFGSAYIQINRYLNYFASFVIIIAIAIILFFCIRTILKKT